MVNKYKKDQLIDTHKVKTPYFSFVSSSSVWLYSHHVSVLVITTLWLAPQVHLMCLIASGMFRNRLCSEPDLLAITLSLLPPHFAMVSKDRIDRNYLSGLLKWCVLVKYEVQWWHTLGWVLLKLKCKRLRTIPVIKLLWFTLLIFIFLSLWRFKATFTLNPSLPCEERPDPWALLGRRLASLSAKNHQEMTHVGICSLVRPISCSYQSELVK